MPCRALRVALAFVCLASFATASVDLAFAASPCPVQYSHPTKAARIRSSLVQAFVPCGNAFFPNAPNATTETGTVPSCYPAETWHEAAGSPNDGWSWGPKGKGSIDLKAGTNALVPDAGELFVRLQLSDVRTNTGIADDLTGGLSLVLRVTLIDRANDDLMTILDFPFSAPFPIHNGKASLKTSLSAMLDDIDQPPFPRCTAVEVLSVLITDSNGTWFAVPGTYLP